MILYGQWHTWLSFCPWNGMDFCVLSYVLLSNCSVGKVEPGTSFEQYVHIMPIHNLLLLLLLLLPPHLSIDSHGFSENIWSRCLGPSPTLHRAPRARH
jgi:hypothetical protein